MTPAPDSPSCRNDEAAGRGDTGTLGLRLFIVSLTILFAATLIGYLVVRTRAKDWPPDNLPMLGFWVATGVLLLSGVTMQGALMSVRRNRFGALIGLVMITALLGTVFVFVQVVNWSWLVAFEHMTPRTGLYMFMFYLLTALHALHVSGGLVYLWMVVARAFGGRYSAQSYADVRHAATYWHFLDGVWLVMFVVLFLV